MGTLVKIPYNGKAVDAEDIEFSVEAQNEDSFLLEGGYRLRFMHKVNNIYKLKNELKADGSPVFVVIGEANLSTEKIETSEAK